ncbi:MAG: DUF1559 domain-containing protein [Fuerstiella sp.]
MMALPSKRRGGFTLVELVVVCATTAVLASLTVPAVQDARQAARSTLCKNQLKRFGLALHNYHDVNLSMPAAWYSRYADADSRSWTGWGVDLLPLLKNASLCNRIWDAQETGSQCPAWPTDEALLKMPLPMFRCPSDRIGPQNSFRGGFGTSSYSGNGGAKPFGRLYAGTLQEFWPGGLPVPFGATTVTDRKTAGIFSMNGCTRFRDITDGTSNTLLLTERSALSGGGLWMGVRSNQMENDAITEFSWLSPLNKSFTGASSFHSGGVNMLMCDGSVRFVSESISSGTDAEHPSILQALAARSDGMRIGEF